MAESQVLKGLEEELICSFCSHTYWNPVSFSCGHSFCEACVKQGCSSCPLCGAREAPAMKLQPFIQVYSRGYKVEHEVDFWEGESSYFLGGKILCDFCLQNPQPAVKTCMNCETSLCQAHLGKHSAKAFLTSHVLVEPCDARVLAERRCSQHGKLLECYCVTDSVCVCMLCCATSSHRSHEIISVDEAFGQAQNDFPKTLQTLEGHKAAVNKSLENLLTQQEKIKALEGLHRNELENSFNAVCEHLESRKTKILEAISDIERKQLSQLEPWIKELEEMKDAVSSDVQEMEALRDQKDPVLFVKGLAAIQARKREQVPSKDGVELAELLSTMDGSIKKTIQELFQPYVQFILDTKPSVESSPTHEHLTFKSCQAHGLRVDDKVLSVVKLPYSFSVPSKVPSWVYSTRRFWNGQHFWEVITRNSSCWKVGVVDNSFQCYLEMSQRCLRVFLDKRQITAKSLKTAMGMVRVELDCERNTVSFFNVSDKDTSCSSRSCVPIATVTIPASYPVYAVFSISHGSLSLPQ